MDNQFFIPSISSIPLPVVQQHEGGFGRIYVVTDPKGTRYALKTLKWELSLKQSQLAEEALKLIKIPPHPNVIQVKELVWKDGAPYLLMSYYPTSLRSEIKPQAKTQPSHAAQITLQIADALNHLHNKAEMLHLDLKPENILRSSDGLYVLSDFGISKLVPPPKAGSTHAQLFLSGIVGTIAYLSPEQVVSRSVSAKSDIFALGIILFELLTGTHPFVADTLESTVRNILYKEIKFSLSNRFSIAKNLIQVCLACLHKNPDYRPSSFEIIRILGASSDPYNPPKTEPLQLEATINKANTLMGLGAPHDAETLLRNYLASYPWTLIALINLAQALFLQRKFDEAIQVAEDAISTFDWSKHEQKSLGTLLTNLSNYLMSVDPMLSASYARKAIQLDPFDWQGYGNLAESLRAVGESRKETNLLAEAEEAINNALAINPNDVKLRTTYAGILLAKGDHATLNPILVKLMNEVGEHDIMVRFLFIRTCIKTGQLDAAVRCLNPMRSLSYLKDYITQLDQDIAKRRAELQQRVK